MKNTSGNSDNVSAGRLFLKSIINERDEQGQPLNFDALNLAELTDIDVESGRCRCSLTITRRHQNRYGTLHGGCIGRRCCLRLQISPIRTELILKQY